MIYGKTTINKFITEVISVYEDIEKLGMKGIPKKRITFLETILRNRDIENNELSKDNLLQVLIYIFDAITINFASNSKETLKISDVKLLGKVTDLRGKTEKQQIDWIFQLLIQCFLQLKGSGPLSDLKTKFKNIVCEFHFKKNGIEYLVECKHLNKGPSKSPNVLCEKIRDKVKYNQLSNTEKMLDIKAVKTMFVDISAYIDGVCPFKNEFYDVEIYGPTDSYVKKLKETLINEYIKFDEKLDQLVICWDKTILINGSPIVFSKSGIVLGKHTDFDFDGLAIEAFPMKGKDCSFSELRIRTNINRAKYIYGVLTTMNNLTSPETFFKIGPEEKLR